MSVTGDDAVAEVPVEPADAPLELVVLLQAVSEARPAAMTATATRGLGRPREEVGRSLLDMGFLGLGAERDGGESRWFYCPSRATPVRLRRKTAASARATTTATPLNTSVIHGWTPISVRPLTAVPTKNRAMMVPGTL